jgi:hypothetical protein
LSVVVRPGIRLLVEYARHIASRLYPQLVENSLDVMANRVLADRQFGSDLGVRSSRGQKLGDIHLAGRQAKLARSLGAATGTRGRLGIANDDDEDESGAMTIRDGAPEHLQAFAGERQVDSVLNEAGRRGRERAMVMKHVGRELVCEGVCRDESAGRRALRPGTRLDRSNDERFGEMTNVRRDRHRRRKDRSG